MAEQTNADFQDPHVILRGMMERKLAQVEAERSRLELELRSLTDSSEVRQLLDATNDEIAELRTQIAVVIGLGMQSNHYFGTASNIDTRSADEENGLYVEGDSTEHQLLGAEALPPFAEAFATNLMPKKGITTFRTDGTLELCSDGQAEMLKRSTQPPIHAPKHSKKSSKTERRETIVNVRELEGYRGEEDIDRLLAYIDQKSESPKKIAPELEKEKMNKKGRKKSDKKASRKQSTSDPLLDVQEIFVGFRFPTHEVVIKADLRKAHTYMDGIISELKQKVGKNIFSAKFI